MSTALDKTCSTIATIGVSVVLALPALAEDLSLQKWELSARYPSLNYFELDILYPLFLFSSGDLATTIDEEVNAHLRKEVRQGHQNASPAVSVANTTSKRSGSVNTPVMPSSTGRQ